MLMGVPHAAQAAKQSHESAWSMPPNRQPLEVNSAVTFNEFSVVVVSRANWLPLISVTQIVQPVATT
jgi:hypothetical protein